MLKYHAHFSSVQIDVHIFVCKIHTVKIDMAGCGHLQHVQAAEHGALPRSAAADNGHHLAPVHREAAAVERFHFTFVIFLYHIHHTDELTVCRHDASSFQSLQFPWKRDS